MNKLLSNSKRFWNRNASTILTCVGGAGVVATSIMAVKETPKALKLLEEAKKEKGEDLSKIEIVKVAGPVYIPSIIMGATTLTCIFSAQILNKRQQAAITSAYALLDNSYKNYKKKVIELYGKDADQQVKEEISRDNYENSDVTVEDDKQLFYDDLSGRHFESTIQAVQEAEYRLNRQLSTTDYATLNDFYDLLGIPHIKSGDTLGWSSGKNFEFYWQSWIDFSHEKVVMDDGLECYILYIQSPPTLDFENY